MTGIPVSQMDSMISIDLKIWVTVQTKVIGQDKTVEAVGMPSVITVRDLTKVTVQSGSFLL